MEIAADGAVNFGIQVLGRTLEHMGVQMYKQRPTAIAELVANSWDACAKTVTITLGTENYDKASSTVIIEDDGQGMNPDQIQGNYLVIGRNRRMDKDPADKQICNRAVMGRKGIGKLAGFGLAERITVETWQANEKITFTLNINDLKEKDDVANRKSVAGRVAPTTATEKTDSGTRITLRGLKHSSAVDLDSLRDSLARRFSRQVRGEMTVIINGNELQDVDLEYRKEPGDYEEHTLDDGNKVRFRFGCTTKPIKEKDVRGLTIYARGKTVQAPPFYFDVEATATGQHGTRYLIGEIEADFLDAEDDDESDIVSTDRQEIDWESPKTNALKEWGEKFARTAIAFCATKVGEEVKDWVIQQEVVKGRIARLDSGSRKQITDILIRLGKGIADAENKERIVELADSLVKAFEFRQFYDVVSTIEEMGDDPEKIEQLLSHLQEWKVLESRAILEIVDGRLKIIDKFEQMVLDRVPETASVRSLDNMHDLLAGYPWLLNPEWQVFVEEKRISKWVMEQAALDLADKYSPDDLKQRFDFLAMDNGSRRILIEIKRPGHAVEFDELQRLDKYTEMLSTAEQTGVEKTVLVYSGSLNIREAAKKNYEQREDFELIQWGELVKRARTYYGHYRAVLEADINSHDFGRKATEVATTRQVLESGTVHRDKARRASGIGVQDVDYTSNSGQNAELEAAQSEAAVSPGPTA
jgi:primosomal replication protein N